MSEREKAKGMRMIYHKRETHCYGYHRLGALLDHREGCSPSGLHVTGKENSQDENDDYGMEVGQDDEIQGKTDLAYEQEQEEQDSNEIPRHIPSPTVSFLTQFRSETPEPPVSMTAENPAAAFNELLFSGSGLSVSGCSQPCRQLLNEGS